ncbi:hypothetical protein PINS_up012725 [Pythium insidiosum]|nr:hypothetical protein PINS_up012725 [Pythium insidiosum]
MVVSIQVLSVASPEDGASAAHHVGGAAYPRERRRRHAAPLLWSTNLRMHKLTSVLLTEIATHTVGGSSWDDSHGVWLWKGRPSGAWAPKARPSLSMRHGHFVYRPEFQLQVDEAGAAAATTTAAAVYCEDEDVAVRSIPVSPRDLDHAFVSYVVETPEQRGKFLVDKAAGAGRPQGQTLWTAASRKGRDAARRSRRASHRLCVAVAAWHRCRDRRVSVGRVRVGSGGVAAVGSLPPSSASSRVATTGARARARARSKRTATALHQHRIPRRHRHRQPQPQQQPARRQSCSCRSCFISPDASVLQHPQYVAWVQSFGPEVEHVLLRHAGCAEKTVYRASALLQAQLHAVFPTSFPPNDHERHNANAGVDADADAVAIGAATGADDAKDPTVARRVSLSLSSTPVVLGESMLKYTLAPVSRRGLDASSCFAPVNLEEVKTSMAGFVAQVAKADADADNGVSAAAEGSNHSSRHKALPSRLNGRVTFLGTGCAIPSKYRNVTGIHLEFPDDGDSDTNTNSKSSDSTSDNSADEDVAWSGMMLDCGEGSLGQLYRCTNGDERRLQTLLSAVAGQNVDGEREALSPLMVIGPTPVEHWLKEYAAVDASIAGSYTFVDDYCFNDQDARYNDQATAEIALATRSWLLRELHITSFECVPVEHADPSYAVVFTWKSEVKIAFSGDCRPSEALAARAKDAFLLIHEATFDDSLDEDASTKAHSTTIEALDVGRAANAQHIVLTHFSQRYPKVSSMLNSSPGSDAMTAVDLLSLRFSELGRHAALMPICQDIMMLDETDE